MNRLIVLLLVSSGGIALGQDNARTSTLTLGVGGLPYSNSRYYPTLQKGGAAFTGNYEYRLFRYLAVEGGTNILVPSGQSIGRVAVISAGQNLVSLTPSTCSPVCSVMVAGGRSQITLLTYGVKGILPLASDRLELFAGVGGAYGWNSEFNGSLNSAFAQASLGGRFAVDRGHRFWIGTTLRGFNSFGPGRQAWVPLTFDFGIRFGRH